MACLWALGWGSAVAQTLDFDASSFQLHPDFQIELIAAEPVVMDPVDMKFDERGRVFVLEMAGYPFAIEEQGEFPGRIVIISDSDDDGVFDRRQVFARNFRFADSILPYRGGLLVADPPHLVFLEDTNGDGQADRREIILGGFSVGNPQHNFSALTYGLDNWIYAANGGNSGQVYWAGGEASKTSIRGADFRFKLEGKRFERIGATSGGFGLAMDPWGRIFTVNNRLHIQHLVFPSRYLDSTPLPGRRTLSEISDHGLKGLARIYQFGVPRTRVNHPEQSGYFSGACGSTYYGGGAFPEGFNSGNVFVADVVMNLIHRDVLRPDGASFLAARGRDREEFLACSDPAFRPVTMEVGPDGALYVLDFHRDVIEHPEWIPDELEANLDLDAGKNQGRIYRISPRSGLPRVDPKFDRNDLDEVVRHLADVNQWWRVTAQRLLMQWQDPGSIAPLKDLLAPSQDPRARAHAMWTLHGLGALDDEALKTRLHDSHPGVRENALLIAETRWAASSTWVGAVASLAGDPDPRVRMQVALALGTLDPDDAGSYGTEIDHALGEIARRGIDDPWTRKAVLSAAAARPLPLLRSVVAWATSAGLHADRSKDAGISDFVNQLALLTGRRGETDEIVSALKTLEGLGDEGSQVASALLDGLATGLEGRSDIMARRDRTEIERLLDPYLENDSLEVVRGAWAVANRLGLDVGPRREAVLEEAAGRVLDVQLPAAERLSALRFLELAEFGRREEILFGALEANQPPQLQLAAMDQLASESSPSVAQRLVQMWKELTTRVRSEAGDLLIYRRANHELLLSNLEEGAILVGELNFDLERRRRLLRSRDPEVRRRAEAFFSDAGVVTRREALERLKPALLLKGDPGKGQAQFTRLCANCHRVLDEGSDVAPNLTDIFRKSAETLLHDIVDPNAAANTEHIGYTIETESGEIINGLLTDETDLDVTLLEAYAKRTIIPRAEIREIYSTGLSFMPEELDSDLEPQDMADLLSFLQQRR